jgi:hypothetical protein
VVYGVLSAVLHRSYHPARCRYSGLVGDARLPRREWQGSQSGAVRTNANAKDMGGMSNHAAGGVVMSTRGRIPRSKSAFVRDHRDSGHSFLREIP